MGGCFDLQLQKNDGEHTEQEGRIVMIAQFFFEDESAAQKCADCVTLQATIAK